MRGGFFIVTITGVLLFFYLFNYLQLILIDTTNDITKTLTNGGLKATTNRAYGTIKVLCSFSIFYERKERNNELSEFYF